MVWLALIILLVVVEALTVQLVAVWFIAGGIVAFVLSLFAAPLWLQFGTFVVVSTVVLLLVRPLALKRARHEKIPTNADMSIGKTAVVIREIDNERGMGRVELDGQDWAAVSVTGEVIPVGHRVTVQRIEGVKLIVVPQ